MKPIRINRDQGHLFSPMISSFIDPKNKLKILADKINWAFFEEEFGSLYKAGAGYPPKPVRLMVGLLMLEYMFKLSDERVVEQWKENPYWQYFCGYNHLQWKTPINPSSLTRFRNRLGEKGISKILESTIQEGLKQGAVSAREVKKVIVDTTVMEKNITYPTDSSLLNKARKKLVRLAKTHKVPLRQNYEKVAPKQVRKVAGYAHAKQFKRLRKGNKKLKTYLGRVTRDVERKITENKKAQEAFQPILDISKKLLAQTKKSKDKIYSVHEPDVYCVAKGKARTPYEYGSKVSVVVTQKSGFALSVDAFAKNQHDSHTLQHALNRAEKLSNHKIEQVMVDRGYRGHKVLDTNVYIAGQKKNLTPYAKKKIKKRSAVEARINELKSQSKLARNYLRGIKGDAINAMLCGVGHNMRRLLTNNYLIMLFFLGYFLRFPSLGGGISLLQGVAKNSKQEN